MRIRVENTKLRSPISKPHAPFRASSHRFLALALLAAAVFCAGSVQAVNKAATGTDLTADASWDGSAPGSGDTAAWITGSLGPGLTLGTGQSWGGISVANASGDIGITGAGTLTLGAGGMDLSASAVNLTIATPVALGASQEWSVNDAKTLTASGIISGTGYNLTKTGAGTLTLDAINTFSGAQWYLNGGTVKVSAESGLGHVGNDVTFGGGTLQVTSGFDVNLGGAGMKVFAVGTSTGTLNIDSEQTLALTVAGNLTANTTGTLIKNGSGTLAIDDVNNGFDGTLRLDQGLLNLGGTISVLGDGTGRATLMCNGGNVVIANNTATFYINAMLNIAADATVTYGRGVASSTTFAQSFNQTTLGGFMLTARNDGLLSSPGIATLDLNAVTLVGDATLNLVNNTDGATMRVLVGAVTDNGYRLTLKGDGDFAQDADWAVGGTGGLTLHEDYSGTATLDQWPNNFSGGLTINGGTLAVAVIKDTTLGSGAVTMNGGTLDFIVSGTAEDTVDFIRDTTVGGNATIISEKATAEYAGRNYQLGILTIGSYTLNIEGGNIPSGTAGIIFDSTTLTGSPTFNVVNPVAGGITAFTPAVYPAAISDGGNSHGITKTGNGLLILSSVNTYTGTTTVNEGTLRVTRTTGLSDDSSVVIASGAEMDLNFTGTCTVKSLKLGGSFMAVGVYGVATHPAFFTAGGAGTLNVLTASVAKGTVISIR